MLITFEKVIFRRQKNTVCYTREELSFEQENYSLKKNQISKKKYINVWNNLLFLLLTKW